MNSYITRFNNNIPIFGHIIKKHAFCTNITTFLSYYFSCGRTSYEEYHAISMKQNKCVICMMSVHDNSHSLQGIFVICKLCARLSFHIYNHFECSICPQSTDVHDHGYETPQYKRIVFCEGSSIYYSVRRSNTTQIDGQYYYKHHVNESKDNRIFTNNYEHCTFHPLKVRKHVKNNYDNLYDRYCKKTFVLFIMARKINNILSMIINDVLVHILRLIY